MALKVYCGVPGSGKTLHTTYQALKHFKKENNRVRFYIVKALAKCHIPKMINEHEYYNQFPFQKINNVYSTYPILLDKKRNIYSNKIKLWDLNNDFSFLPNALIIIDEVQLYVDSDEYKDKYVNARLKNIAKFLQAHRHFGIKEIIFTSQNPSRIFKKGRNICESYLKQKRIVNIPFTHFSIMSGIGYYELDFYGRFIPRDRVERKKLPFDYFKYFRIFNRKVVFSAYDSRYLSRYNFDKPLLELGQFCEKLIDYEDLKIMFENEL